MLIDYQKAMFFIFRCVEIHGVPIDLCVTQLVLSVSEV